MIVEKYKVLSNNKVKVYLDLFTPKTSLKRLFLKPGITRFVNAEDRINYNHKKYLEGDEPDSYLNHFNVKCQWSTVCDSEKEAKDLEQELLDYFGTTAKMNFWTSGASEVRHYDHQKYLTKLKELYKK
jgi:hypothetical protein